MRWKKKLLELANEKFAGVDQIQFTYADIQGNIKVMLKSPVQPRYFLQNHKENDIANIMSRLDCELERFDEIYP